MKSILAVALTVAIVLAEVPSNSYLPPPPKRGYPKSSTPTIVTARALEIHHQGDHQATAAVNGFARSGLNHDHAAHSDAAHHDGAHNLVAHDLGAQARITNNEEQGYDRNAAGFARNAVDDVNATVSYEADERGFKPQVSYEESEGLARSTGYDSNANNFRANNGYHGNEQDGVHANARTNGYN